MSGTLNSGREVMTFSVTKADRLISSTSSKGNQIKWLKDGMYLKADTLGYEGLAECVASDIAQMTNIGEYAPITDYYLCKINEEENQYVGCASPSFLSENTSLITMWRLLRTLGYSYEHMVKNKSASEQIKSVVDCIEGEIGLFGLGEWLTCLMEFDWLILNEDRHPHNIAFLLKSNMYSFMPLFDNGAGFLSDTSIDYKWGTPLVKHAAKVKSKPFVTDFKKQVRAARELYGNQLRLMESSPLSKIDLSGVTVYSEQAKARVKGVIGMQLKTVF